MRGLEEITVVITSHQAGEALLCTVDDALALETAEVWLIDSGSSDGSVERVQKIRPELRVERLATNPGPCATRNLGLARAKTPYVLFLDDDMRLEPDCVSLLLGELSPDSEVVMAGPSIWQSGPEGKARVQYAGGFWNYAGLAHILQAEPEASRDVDLLTSGCVLARREELLSLGGFEELFFFLMEDVDLCLRCRAMGWRLRVAAGAKAWNRGGSEGLSIQDRSYPTRRARLHARNRPLLILSLYEAWSLLLLWPALLLLDVAWFLFALMQGQLGAWLRGRWDFVRILPSLLRRRRRWGRLRKRHDRAFLSPFPVTVTPAAAARAPVAAFLGILNGALRLYWSLVKRALR